MGLSLDELDDRAGREARGVSGVLGPEVGIAAEGEPRE